MDNSNSKLVIMHNDDKTPVDFVNAILIGVFDKTKEESSIISNNIHLHGAMPVGKFSSKDANSKVEQVMLTAQKYSLPFKCEAVSVH